MGDQEKLPDKTTVHLKGSGIEGAVRDYWKIANIDQDVWEAIPIPKRLIIMAKRGVKAAQRNIDEME